MQDVSALTPEVKAYFSQFTSLAWHNGLLYVLALTGPCGYGGSCWCNSRQSQVSNNYCQGRTFSAGERVWVYCPARKKGDSPKLISQWMGPCGVLENLLDIVYWVKLRVRWMVVIHRDRLVPGRVGGPSRPTQLTRYNTLDTHHHRL